MGLAESPGKSLLVPEIKVTEAGLVVDRAQCCSGDDSPSLRHLPAPRSTVGGDGERGQRAEQSRGHQRSPKVHLPMWPLSSTSRERHREELSQHAKGRRIDV